jgi:probable F420-dependent oxidoreductase
MVEFAISVPQLVPDGTFDPAAMRDYLTRAEELGFVSAWTGEQVLGTAPHLDPLATLSFAAACTERIRLGCAVFVSTVHSPLHLAKAIGTVDQMSRGRLEIGLATGGQFRSFAAFGVARDGYLARFTEGLRVMQAVWTQPRITFHGRFWQLDNVAMEPKPAQKPYPPIWFGANARPALARAVRLGDGFLGAGSSTTAAFAANVKVVREELARQGRDPATFRIGKRVYLAVDDDPARARGRITAALDGLYGYFGLPGLAAVAVAGTADDVVAGVREVIDAGAEMIVLNPLDDDRAQMERLAAEVVPRLAGSLAG